MVVLLTSQQMAFNVSNQSKITQFGAKGRDPPPIKTLGTLEITGHFWLSMANYPLAILAFITPI
jgi:hypothetical protein